VKALAPRDGEYRTLLELSAALGADPLRTQAAGGRAAAIGDGVTALGSTLVVNLLCQRPIFAPQFGIYSHRIGATWLAGGASNTGGRVIEHLVPRDRLALLSAALKPDRPTGLNYYPLVDPGERFPVNDLALAPRLEPRPSDEATFFQGVLEGLAQIEALAYRRLRELGGPPLRSVRTVGGGAANDGWTRIRQRILLVPFEKALSQQACDGVARLMLRHAQTPT
jgi:sugar (pentulose or hexulose) kinase